MQPDLVALAELVFEHNLPDDPVWPASREAFRSRFSKFSRLSAYRGTGAAPTLALLLERWWTSGL